MPILKGTETNNGVAELQPGAQVIGSRTGIKNGGRGSTLIDNGLLIKRIYATYAVQQNDGTLLVDASAAPVYIQLDYASKARQGELNVKKIDSSANAVILVPRGTELIDGAVSYSNTTQYISYQVIPEPGYGYWLI